MRGSGKGKRIAAMLLAAVVVWTVPMDQEGEEGNALQLSMDMQLTVVRADGTEVQVEPKLTSDDTWVDSVYISDTGRILVNAAGNTLYEVKEDGSFENLLSVEEGRIPSCAGRQCDGAGH